MSEFVEEIVLVEEIEDDTEFLVFDPEPDPSLLGKVLRPKGTRSFPANTGAIQVRNNSNEQGNYRYRFGADGQWVNRTINSGALHGYNPGNDEFFLKNTGDVDLDVTP